MPDVPLLATKIEPPRLRSGHVPRPALIQQLRHGLHRRLTLVEAAAGSGKTTLLVEWCEAEAGHVPFAWLSLDEGDNDPVRFWTYVASALRHAGVEIPQAVDAAFAAPAISPKDVGVPQLVNALAGSGAGVVLVLDDYHLIREPEIHESVGFFLERSPPGVQLAIASRAAPPVGVARLRVRGELGEVPAEELRFDRASVGLLLNDGLGLELQDTELDLLLERTEGWAAGLYLAGLSLQTRGGAGGDVVGSFSGEQRHLADYLLEEVLAGQPEELRSFLIRSSLLDRLSAPLCDALFETDASHDVLTAIERSNMFLIPLDSQRHWFRYHPLFQDVLRREAGRELAEDEIRRLHARAAAWLAERGEVDEAIKHHVAADDQDAAARLIARSWNHFLQRGEVFTASRWIDGLPRELVLASPQLSLARGWLSLDVGDLVRADQWVTAAIESSTDEAAPLHEGGTTVASGLAMLSSTLAYQAGDLATSRDEAEAAVLLEGDSGSPWLAVALTTLGCSRYWQGDTEGARSALVSVVRIAEAGTNNLAVLRALSMLAVADADAEDLAGAGQWIALASELTERENLGEYWMGALNHAAAGRLSERAGDLAGAASGLRQAAVLARRGVARPELIYSLHALAPVLAATGDADGAKHALREARRTLKACPAPGVLAHLVADAERRLRGKAAPAPTTADDGLSNRELAVLRLLPSELSFREIGGELFISQNTVKTHVQRIYRKLGADTRAEAVARARELRLL